MSVRILIADDDASIRRLLHRLVESHAEWNVCAEACDGQEAIGKAAELTPDIVVLDLAMPLCNGLQAGREIVRHSPSTPMLLLTVQQVSNELAKEAIHAGFKGAVSKNTGSEVVRAIEMLLNQQRFFEPAENEAYLAPRLT